MVSPLKRYRLMIPGPAGSNSDALAEMGAPVVAHYGPEWVEAYRETIDLTRQVFCTEGDVFLIPGSGTSGLEAAIGSTIGSDFRVAVPINGEYADRLLMLATGHSDNVVSARFDIARPLPAEQIDNLLRENPSIRMLAAVHCESATGILNPIREIGRICRERDVLFMVDAVSSLGGAELKMDEWNIDICVTAAQKCLETPPGLSLVALNPRAMQRVAAKKEKCGWYLNLKVWSEYAEKWSEWHPYPVTLNTNNILALRASLLKIVQETLSKRQKRHRDMMTLVRQGLRNLGFELFADDEWASPTLTAACTDERISVPELLAYVKERHGIMLAGSGGEVLPDKIFRVGHMGTQATTEAVVAVLLSIEDALRWKGAELDAGRCLRGIRFPD